MSARITNLWQKEPQYLKMVAVNAMNRFGDSIDLIAFGWLVYEITGSGTWLAMSVGVSFLPTVFLQPFTGAWVSYLNKKKVMAICDICRGSLVLITFFCFVNARITPSFLMFVMFSNSVLEAFRQPCGLSILTGIVSKEKLEPAMALNQSVSRASELVGMGLAGVLISVVGLGGVILVDACSFFASGSILLTIRYIDVKIPTRSHYLRELVSGFQYFKSSQILILVTLLCCFINFTTIPIEGLRAAFIQDGLNLSENALGTGSAALSFGLFFGAAGYSLLKKLRKSTVFIGCGMVTGMIYFGLWGSTFLDNITAKLVLYGVLCFVYGLCSAAVGVALNVVMIQKVEHVFLSRVSGIFNSLACASIPVSSFIFAGLQRWLSISQIYFFTAWAAIIGFLLLLKRKNLDDMQ